MTPKSVPSQRGLILLNPSVQKEVKLSQSQWALNMGSYNLSVSLDP